MKRIMFILLTTLALIHVSDLSAQVGRTPFAYQGSTNMMGATIQFNQPIRVPTTPDSVMIIEYIYAGGSKSSTCMIAIDQQGAAHVELEINNLPTHLVIRNGDKIRLFRPKKDDVVGVYWYVSGYMEHVP